MSAIQCFWLEETNRARRYLRRFASRHGDDLPSDEACPVNGYHNAMVAIDDVPVGRKPWEHGDRMVTDYGGAESRGVSTSADTLSSLLFLSGRL